MSLIFDGFPTRVDAALFALTVSNAHELDVAVFGSASAAHAADPFPGDLRPPIVHVERSDEPGVEATLEALAEVFGGAFRGT